MRGRIKQCKQKKNRGKSVGQEERGKRVMNLKRKKLGNRKREREERRHEKI